MRVAGIMSGTSLDGIDVAIADITRTQLQTVAVHSEPYPASLRARILQVSNADTHTSAISRLNFELGERYAAAVQRACLHAGLKLPTIELIGCHGQTIFHEEGNTLQVGESSVIAERLKIPVISDFRTRDIAAGGQGAPLVPFVDYRLFRHATKGRVALNIGGIANFTAIPAGGTPEQVIAFDTGPGNMVMDGLVWDLTDGKQRFDRNGAIAARAEIHRPLLESLLQDPYYRAKPPKSAGREQYGAAFITRLKSTGLDPERLIATATALTATTIAKAIQRFIAFPVSEVIVSGGGAHNKTLMALLTSLLPELSIATTNDFGIPVNAKEALAFAVLAWESFHQRPSNLPSATGARRPVILGKLTR